MLFIFVYKSFRLIYRRVKSQINHFYTIIKFYGNGVQFYPFKSDGVPFVSVAKNAKMIIGMNFSMHNTISGNPIGCCQPCTFFVDEGSCIIIGNNVGISQTALISYSSLIIEDNVKIGGGTCIYTSDFHSIDPEIRRDSYLDKKDKKIADVIIKKNAFIGAKCIILKGVTIGENAVIGAGSIVTKNVPPNQLWAGNPAHYIKTISNLSQSQVRIWQTYKLTTKCLFSFLIIWRCLLLHI